MLSDPEIRIVERGIDSKWARNDHCLRASGWNPWSSRVYTAGKSAIGLWLDDPESEVRALNAGDFLVKEILTAVHDYLHLWAVRVIQHLVPEREHGFGPITESTVEEHAFLALLTEAVATVGLDYWFLSCIDLGAALDIGTEQKTFATSYHEQDLQEFRQFEPQLEVQSVEFFGTIARSYCTGALPLFSVSAINRSPKLRRWLRHELKYGAIQRLYIRSWLSHLAGRRFFERSELERPVPCDAKWQERLIGEVGQRLWDKVKPLAEDTAAPTPGAVSDRFWRAPDQGPIDARYTNVLALDNPEAALAHRGLVAESYPYLFAQLISSLVYAESRQALSPSLPAVAKSGSVELLFLVTRDRARLALDPEEPIDLFFPG